MFTETSRGHHGGRRGFARAAAVFSTALLAAAYLAIAPSATAAQCNEFVRRVGPKLKLRGQDFRFAGSNTYYLAYSSTAMVDDLLKTAEAQGVTVVRTWGSIDIGNQDGSNSLDGMKNGVYFQYWNGTAPAYNDGADGLQHLDYVLAAARKLGLKVVLPLVNNWQAFGGIDQYVKWRGGSNHDLFFTDPVIQQWYKNWVRHLLTRTNSITGVEYRDDPTILSWDLINEPRCHSDTQNDGYPQSSSCTTTTLTTWTDEMSHYVKRIDAKHLISAGDEGYYCDPTSTDWTEDCNEGVDTIALAHLSEIDYMSYHLYPEPWGKTVAWAQDWIDRHVADALAMNKPAVMGEFGYQYKSMRNPVYKLWTDTTFQDGGAGGFYWMLAGHQDDGSLYPDYDGYTVYCPSPVCTALGDFAQMMTTNRDLRFPPVADHDNVRVYAGRSTTLSVLANDVAYNDAKLLPGSVNLDPSTSGRQTSLSVSGGSFVANADGTLVFTPDQGFTGAVGATNYVAVDSRRRVSNVANIGVTVKSLPDGAVVLDLFDSGTEGWTGDDASTLLAQSTDFATIGSYSLKVTTYANGSNNGGWVSKTFDAPLDLSGTPLLQWDLKTISGLSRAVAIQDKNWNWCQTNDWSWINSGASTQQVDLSTLGCDLTQVQAIHFWLSGDDSGMTNYVGNILAVPIPTGGTVLASFEDGTDGWVSLNGLGTTAQTTAFHTLGSYGLQVTPTTASVGDWYGTQLSPTLNISGKQYLKWDIQTLGSGTSAELAIQAGSGWTWCQAGGWGWVNANTTTTVTIDLTTFDCGTPDLTQLQSVYLFLGNDGADPVYIDNVRAE